MRHPQPFIWLLIVAMVSADASVLTWVAGRGWSPPQWPHALLCLLFALVFSQVGLATIWAGLGRQSMAWRVTGGFLVVVAWSIALARELQADRPIELLSTYWSVLLSVQAGLALVPLLIMRAAGARLISTAAAEISQDRGSQLGPWQFSPADLLRWMTALAVIMGLAQSVAFYDLLPRSSTALAEIGTWAAANTLLALFTLWAVLGNGPPVARILTLAVIASVTAGLLGWLAPNSEKGEAAAMLYVLQTILLTASLGVVRIAGYRLASARPNDEPPHTSV
ncbi:MAG: hypothetical protein V3R99_01150 [Thermoguttaceae bacterium]